MEHTLDGAALRVADESDKADDSIGCGRFCGHRAVYAAFLQHIVVAELVDFGDDFRHVLGCGKHAHDDVLLIHIGKRDKSVRGGKPFFEQKLLIGAVTQNDVDFLEVFREHSRFLSVFFNEFCVYAQFVKLLAKIVCGG